MRRAGGCGSTAHGGIRGGKGQDSPDRRPGDRPGRVQRDAFEPGLHGPHGGRRTGRSGAISPVRERRRPGHRRHDHADTQRARLLPRDQDDKSRRAGPALHRIQLGRERSGDHGRGDRRLYPETVPSGRALERGSEGHPSGSLDPSSLLVWNAVPSSGTVGSMNSLDIGILALCAVLGLLGLLQGFIRQAASWAGLILGLVAGWRYGEAARMLLQFDFTGGAVAAYLLVLLAVYIAVRLIGLLVERWVRGTKLSGADRFLGLLAGLAKGVLVSILLVFFLVLLLPRDASLLKGSKISPRLMVAARWMEGAFPERIRESFREKMRAEPEPGREKGETGEG